MMGSAAPRVMGRLAGAPPPAPIVRLGLPLAASFLAVGLVDATAVVLPGGGAFLLLLPPVMAISLGLGLTSGLLTLGLCALGAGLLVPLRGHPWLSEPADVIRLALYLVEGTLVAILSFGLRVAAKETTTSPRPPDGIELRVLTTREFEALTTRELEAATTHEFEALTTRELEVLTLAAAGLRTDEVARQMFISRNTVKTHLAHAYAKLGARNRAQAVATALRLGVIELPPGESSGWSDAPDPVEPHPDPTAFSIRRVIDRLDSSGPGPVVDLSSPAVQPRTAATGVLPPI